MLREKTTSSAMHFSTIGSGPSKGDRKPPPTPHILPVVPYMSAAMLSALQSKLDEVDVRLKITQQLPMIDFSICTPMELK